jgi:hypothetical protein
VTAAEWTSRLDMLSFRLQHAREHEAPAMIEELRELLRPVLLKQVPGIRYERLPNNPTFSYLLRSCKPVLIKAGILPRSAWS